MHSDFTTTRTLKLSQISVFVLMVILTGMSACGTSDTNSLAKLSKGSTTATNSEPADRPREATPAALLNSQTPRPGSPDQTSDLYPDLTLEPKLVLTQIPLPDRPPIGTELGKTLPQVEITLFGGRKKSIASLSNVGRPVFLFFFTTW